MTHEQFTYWLEGYLTGTTVPYDNKNAIRAKMREIDSAPAVKPVAFPPGISISSGPIAGGVVTTEAYGRSDTVLFDARVGDSTINCGAPA